jgi:hypothetical protein
MLVMLAGVRGIDLLGDVIAKQWMHVPWRVLPLRGYVVKRSLEVLLCRGEGSSSNRDGD